MRYKNKTSLLITIDTETSIGYTGKDYKPIPPEARILGKIGNKSYGIPLIMDLLEKYNFKGVFFLNVYEYFYHGDEIKKIAQEIKKRGHDIQLHVHKEWLIFKYWIFSINCFYSFLISFITKLISNYIHS